MLGNLILKQTLSFGSQISEKNQIDIPEINAIYFTRDKKKIVKKFRTGINFFKNLLVRVTFGLI